MDSEADDSLTDKGRLLFGAGFVFGVMTTMLVMAVVVVVVSDREGLLELLRSSIMLTVLAGIVFAAIIGVGLYLLAFPENRTRIPIDPEQFERPAEEDGEE